MTLKGPSRRGRSAGLSLLVCLSWRPGGQRLESVRAHPLESAGDVGGVPRRGGPND